MNSCSGHNDPHRFSGGKTAALFTNVYTDTPPINGTIKVLGPNKLRLSLTVDELPDWCDDGKLGINLLFDESSFKEMDLALDKVISASNNRLATLRDVMYKKIPPAFEKLNEEFKKAALNQSQNNAVNKILAAKDIAIIHDLIVVPDLSASHAGSDTFRAERSLVEKELERVMYFASLAINPYETENVFAEICGHYDLNIYTIHDKLKNNN